VSYAFGELEKAGYTIGSAYTAVRDPQKTRFIYRDRLWAGADLLSLGVASFGHIGGTHYQNHHDFQPYVDALRQERLPIYRALTPTAEERFIREFILQLKLGRVRLSYFRDKFGMDPLRQLAELIRLLQQWGHLEIQEDTLIIRRDGLLQIDRLLHEFFLPQHRNARYA
jgi:oxygen-independent coproporphyrinogen-3 oxidase